MSDEKLTLTEIVTLAADAGAKAALDRIEQERQRERQEMQDRRLYNVKLLLKNYRSFRFHAENAAFEVEIEEDPIAIIEELMMPSKSPKLVVESIKRSVARTVAMVKHIDTMMQYYQIYCAQFGSDEDQRRWRVIDSLYISDHRIKPAQIAEKEGVVERTIYKDIDIACDNLAPLLFGVDGIKKR